MGKGHNISFRGRKARTPLVISMDDPDGYSRCDGCGFIINYRDRKKHMVYRGGTAPVWDGFFVCDVCDDVPNPAPQFSRLTLLPDPVPLDNPRPDTPTPAPSGFGYLVTETGLILNTLSNGDTWGGEAIITIPTEYYP